MRFNTIFPKTRDTKFVVENITIGTSREKLVRIFDYPIPPGKQRDLLMIPSVSEADIRHSLLKGELKIKLEVKEVVVVASNIDLLQFDPEQKAFLESVGVIDGLSVDGAGSAIPFVFKQGVGLSGSIDDVNTTYVTSDKFISGAVGANELHIAIYHNGRLLAQGVDYTIAESGGVGTGYDTINIVSFIPETGSTITADYMVLS